MMKVKIKSLDNFNQNYEKLFELEKVLEQKEKKEYYYGDEYGNCKIIDKGDSIEIYRYGEINSRQIFQSNKNTPFTYITKQFHGKYKIFTKKIFNYFFCFIITYFFIILHISSYSPSSIISSIASLNQSISLSTF